MPSRTRRALVLWTCTLLMAGCSAGTSPEPASTPSGTLDPLPRATVMVGADPALRFLVEVADDEEEMAKGLMDRPSLAPETGMVFLYDAPTEGAFWMKDTLIPLTIAFWNDRGRIVSILEMEPCTADPCPLYAPGEEYVGALEVNAGELDGIQVGDPLTLDPEGGA